MNAAYLAAASHAGPNGDGWAVLAILACLAVLWWLLARRRKRGPS